MVLKVLGISMAIIVFSSYGMAANNGLIGALLGAGVGAGIGHAVDRTGGSGKGAIIGAIGGYVIGNQLEKNDPPAAQEPAVQPTTQQTTRQRQQGSTLNASNKPYRNCSNADQFIDRATQSGNNDDRIYYLEKAIQLCPEQARAHNDLGVAYYNRNARHDNDRAKSEFQRALSIDPGYKVAETNLQSL